MSDWTLAKDYLRDLRFRCSTFGDRELKESIASASLFLEETDVKIDAVSKPFIDALEMNPGKFAVPSMKFLVFLFNEALRGKELTHSLFFQSIKAICNIHPNSSNEVKQLTCNALKVVVGSSTAANYLHCDLLEVTVKYLHKLVLGATSEKARVDAASALTAMVERYIAFANREEPIPYPEIDPSGLSKYVVDSILSNVIECSPYMSHMNGKGTVYDIDLVKIIGVLLSHDDVSSFVKSSQSVIIETVRRILQSGKSRLRSPLMQRVVFNKCATYIPLLIQFGYIGSSEDALGLVRDLCVVYGAVSVHLVKHIFDKSFYLDLRRTPANLKEVLSFVHGFVSEPWLLRAISLVNTEQISSSLQLITSYESVLNQLPHKSVLIQPIADILEEVLNTAVGDAQSATQGLTITPKNRTISLNEEQRENVRSTLDSISYEYIDFPTAFHSFFHGLMIPPSESIVEFLIDFFSSKYYEENPSVFESKSASYNLSFSTFNLHIDLSNQLISEHMTFEQFKSLNYRGNEGKQFPDSILRTIFDAAIKNPAVTLTEGIMILPIFSTASKKQMFLSITSNDDIHLDNCRISRKIREDCQYLSIISQSSSVIFKFAVRIIRESDSEQTKNSGLQIMRLLFRLAALSYREDICSQVIEFFMTQTQQEMVRKQTNYIFCENLMACAARSPSGIGSYWPTVFGVASFLISKDITHFVDELIAASSTLNTEDCVQFVRGLSLASANESSRFPPRNYCLRQFPAVVYWNVHRPLCLWWAIWKQIESHFVLLSASPFETVSEVVVDVLGQICLTFLRSRPSSSKHLVLKAFLTIFSQTESPKIRELILTYLTSIVSEHAADISTGWEIVFQIMTEASLDQRVSSFGFSLVEEISMKFPSSIADNLVHFMAVLELYIQFGDQDTQIKATSQYEVLAGLIQPDDNETWICLIENLAKCIQGAAFESAQNVLLSILKVYGCQRNILQKRVWDYFFESTLVYLQSSPQFYNFVVLVKEALVSPYVATNNNVQNRFKYLIYDTLKHLLSGHTSKGSNRMVFEKSTADSEEYVSAIKNLLNLIEEDSLEKDGILAHEENLDYVLAICLDLYSIQELRESIVRIFRNCVSDNKINTLLLQSAMSRDMTVYSDTPCLNSELFRLACSQKSYEYASSIAGEVFRLSCDAKDNLDDWNNSIESILVVLNSLEDDAFDSIAPPNMEQLINLVSSTSTNVRSILVRILERCLQMEIDDKTHSQSH